MTDRHILTPYFLDEFDPEIAAMAGGNWRLVAGDLHAGDFAAVDQPRTVIVPTSFSPRDCSCDDAYPRICI